MDSERKWKVCLTKVPLFFLKNAWGASYKHIYIFFEVPLRGHFLHTSPARISISFFLFVHPRPAAQKSEWLKIDFWFFYFSIHLNPYDHCWTSPLWRHHHDPQVFRRLPLLVTIPKGLYISLIVPYCWVFFSKKFPNSRTTDTQISFQLKIFTCFFHYRKW